MHFLPCFDNMALVATVFMIAGGLALSADPTKIPVSTRYITTKETTLLQRDTKVFTATLCNQFYGDHVNATVLLNNNPSWDLISGVVDYYIVDAPTKHRNESLCTNKLPSGTYQANCYISKWTTSSDLFLVASAVQTDSIVFAVDIEIRPVTKVVHDKITKQVKPNYRQKPMNPFYRVNAEPEILTEIVTIGTTQALAYKETALLNVTFCKNAETTDNYQITSTVFGTDGKSSFTQYLCDKLPCLPGNPDVIEFEGKQLPNNVIHLTTQSGQYQNFLVLIVGWAGEYDPNVKKYIGHFQYNAQISRTP